MAFLTITGLGMEWLECCKEMFVYKSESRFNSIKR
jgi:hypothetical protein